MILEGKHTTPTYSYGGRNWGCKSKITFRSYPTGSSYIYAHSLCGNTLGAKTRMMLMWRPWENFSHGAVCTLGIPESPPSVSRIPLSICSTNSRISSLMLSICSANSRISSLMLSICSTNSRVSSLMLSICSTNSRISSLMLSICSTNSRVSSLMLSICSTNSRISYPCSIGPS